MKTIKHLLNFFNHSTFKFRHLSLHLCHPANLFRVICTVLHVLFKLGPDMLVETSLLSLLRQDEKEYLKF